MFTINVLALALLTAPPSAPIPTIEAGSWPAFRIALRDQAILCEILDSREERLTRLDQLGPDLTVLRRRCRDLRDAPPLHDALRFPNRHQVSDMLQFNRAYRRHLDQRQLMDRDLGSVFKDAIHETDELYRVWELVREATCEIYYVPVRRQALKSLREVLGPAAYCACDLPPHVPLWRFIEAR
jgi:hypothetical protein